MARDRYGCAAHRQKGTCPNSRTIVRDRVEARILGGLKERMLTPDLVAEFVRTLAAETAEAQAAAASTRTRLERELAEVERRLRKLMDAIETGGWLPTMRGRMEELEARKLAITDELATIGRPAPVAVLHPNAAELYRQRVAELEAALNDPEVRTEAAEILQALIERVVLTPDDTAPDRLRAELNGDLAIILHAAAGAEPAPPAQGAVAGGGNGKLPGTGVLGSQLSLVAGTGF